MSSSASTDSEFWPFPPFSESSIKTGLNQSGKNRDFFRQRKQTPYKRVQYRIIKIKITKLDRCPGTVLDHLVWLALCPSNGCVPACNCCRGSGHGGPRAAGIPGGSASQNALAWIPHSPQKQRSGTDGAVRKHPRADMFNILAEKAIAAKKGAKPVSEVTTDIHNFFQSKQCVPARPIALCPSPRPLLRSACRLDSHARTHIPHVARYMKIENNIHPCKKPEMECMTDLHK